MKKVITLLFLFSLVQNTISQCITANAGPDRLVCSPNTTVLGTAAQSGYTYSWSPVEYLNNPNIAQPTFNPHFLANTIEFKLIVTPNGSFTNLITNPSFESGNTGFTTDYLVWPNSLYTDGFGSYLVGNNATLMRNYFCGTPRTGSNMLVADGSLGGILHRVWSQTINGLTQNTWYKFTYYTKPISGTGGLYWPALATRINGTVISEITTTSSSGFPPPTCNTWIKEEMVWNSGSSTSAAIDIRSNATNSSGNDFAIDDIELIAICSASGASPVDYVTVSAQPSFPSFNISNNIYIREGVQRTHITETNTIGTYLGCYGWESSVRIEVSASNLTGTDYQWYVNDVLMNNGPVSGIGNPQFENNSRTIVLHPSGPGGIYALQTYKFQATHSAGDCITSSPPVYVKLFPNFYPGSGPWISGNIAGHVSSRYTVTRINPYWIAHDPLPSVTYEWTFPSGVTVSEDGQADNIFSPEFDMEVDNTVVPSYHAPSGNYYIYGTLFVLDMEGCSGFFNVMIGVPNGFRRPPGVMEEDIESKLSISPNPAKNVLNVNLGNAPLYDNSKIEIFSINGQFVKSFTLNSPRATISTSDLTNGLYILILKTGNIVTRKKFVIAK